MALSSDLPFNTNWPIAFHTVYRLPSISLSDCMLTMEWVGFGYNIYVSLLTSSCTLVETSDVSIYDHTAKFVALNLIVEL